MSRFGSKADICGAPTHVRFTPNSDRESGFSHKVMSALPPKADMCSARGYVRFGPIADIALFDHLVSERDQRGRYLEADRLGGLEVEHKIKLCSLYYRQVGWFLDLENAGSVDTNFAIRIGYARPIAHQATCGNELT